MKRLFLATSASGKKIYIIEKTIENARDIANEFIEKEVYVGKGIDTVKFIAEEMPNDYPNCASILIIKKTKKE